VALSEPEAPACFSYPLKQSGFGREGGKYAIKEMAEEKTIVLNI
jgi:acyl-CoA reductase-like NAD-dependent aldehyde dehydrogenase